MSGSRAPDPAAIQADIDRTREHLGRTIDEIGTRLDLRGKAREHLFRVRDTVVETYRESPPLVLGAAALVSAAAGLVIWRRRR
ncbi:DUF3618 domain-containing protein [Modestobacter lapidis]|nr:DUF3618 domain-containing protein [Modestobacter lapidis]